MALKIAERPRDDSSDEEEQVLFHVNISSDEDEDEDEDTLQAHILRSVMRNESQETEEPLNGAVIADEGNGRTAMYLPLDHAQPEEQGITVYVYGIISLSTMMTMHSPKRVFYQNQRETTNGGDRLYVQEHHLFDE